MGFFDRSVLENNDQNNGQVSDITKLEAIHTAIANEHDKSWEYVSSLVSGGTLQPYPAFMSRQAIINGNFDIWQRGTSFVNPLTPQYTADRFLNSSSPDGGVFPIVTHARNPLFGDELGGSTFSYKVDWDGIGSSLGANSAYGVFQRIENATRLMCGIDKKVTISFYARSPIAGKKIGVSLSQRYGTGGNPSLSELLGGKVFTLSAEWQRFTFTVDTKTLNGKTFGTNNNDYLQVGFLYEWGTAAGSTYGLTGTEGFGAVGFIDMTQIQVNGGANSLSFQPRSPGEELQLCRRYFRRIGYGILGQFNSSTEAQFAHTLSVSMRIPPTIALNKTNPQILEMNTGVKVGAASTMYFSAKTESGFIVSLNGFSGGTLGNMTILSDDAIDLDSEL